MSLNFVQGFWNCTCDNCGKVSVKSGYEPGEASENARKEGYLTYSWAKGKPMSWLCRKCASNSESFLKG